ncbi:hypothetical protein EYF80_050526 [Liparis tanakae]|uniref:Uncharacterized protein n=1 Tax=Liparis tanakae TaxID=230148 RepID=A0A4Z2FEB6_9TELE|nr:hypothetical protein EYF80_050526 [Liparis tanakae]
MTSHSHSGVTGRQEHHSVGWRSSCCSPAEGLGGRLSSDGCTNSSVNQFRAAPVGSSAHIEVLTAPLQATTTADRFYRIDRAQVRLSSTQRGCSQTSGLTGWSFSQWSQVELQPVSQVEPGGARWSQVEPGGARWSQVELQPEHLSYVSEISQEEIYILDPELVVMTIGTSPSDMPDLVNSASSQVTSSGGAGSSGGSAAPGKKGFAVGLRPDPGLWGGAGLTAGGASGGRRLAPGELGLFTGEEDAGQEAEAASLCWKSCAEVLGERRGAGLGVSKVSPKVRGWPAALRSPKSNGSPPLLSVASLRSHEASEGERGGAEADAQPLGEGLGWEAGLKGDASPSGVPRTPDSRRERVGHAAPSTASAPGGNTRRLTSSVSIGRSKGSPGAEEGIVNGAALAAQHHRGEEVLRQRGRGRARQRDLSRTAQVQPRLLREGGLRRRPPLLREPPPALALLPAAAAPPQLLLPAAVPPVPPRADALVELLGGGRVLGLGAALRGLGGALVLLSPFLLPLLLAVRSVLLVAALSARHAGEVAGVPADHRGNAGAEREVVRARPAWRTLVWWRGDVTHP